MPPVQTPAERRKEIKKLIWQIGKDISTVQEEMEVRKSYIASSTDFKAEGATNETLVKNLLKQRYATDTELNAQKKLLQKLEDERESFNQELSDINFRQRESQVKAANELAKQMDKLILAADKIGAAGETMTSASNIFVEGVKRMANAVAAMVGRRSAKEEAK